MWAAILLASLCIGVNSSQVPKPVTNEIEEEEWPYVDPCGEGYISIGEIRACIMVVNDKRLTWDEAEEYCEDHSGSLMSIPHDNVSSHVREQLIKGKRYWIGYRADCNEFEDSFGAPLGDYQPWARRQPNNNCKYDVCVEMIANGKGAWVDRPCYRKRRFICGAPMRVAKK